MKYYELKKMIRMIDVNNRDKCLSLLKNHEKRFALSPGSLAKHQNWEGGYIDHLEETMSLAVNLYKFMFNERKPRFSLSDALLILFLHDLEKPFKYVHPKILPISDREGDKKFIKKMIRSEKIQLSHSQTNALKYIHGEGSDYNRTRRIQTQLSAFCHICDTVSARIWFDYPKKEDRGVWKRLAGRV